MFKSSKPAKQEGRVSPASSKGPVFIIGTGRSGTTLLYEVLANHHELAWISNYTNRWPQLPQLAWLSNLTSYEMRGNQLRKRIYVPRPVEGYGAWEHAFPGFRRPQRPLTEADVTEEAQHRLRDMVTAHMRWQCKPRFLGKWTGWSRIGFMRAIFPDARFIHVLRDGRAVARSLMSVPWWDGWDGPHDWRWGELPPELHDTWERAGRSPVVLAALQWKLLVSEIQTASRNLPEWQYLEIRYETLIKDRQAVLDQIARFADLSSSRNLGGVVASASVRDMNSKWASELTREQQEAIHSAIGPDLMRLGY